MKEYKNAANTADIIFENNGGIVLVKRKREPFKGMWALPGGFNNCGQETLEKTAKREFREETGLIVGLNDLKQFGWYSSPKRDPRGHIIAHVYVAGKAKGILKAGDDADKAIFFPLNALPKLAFDHEMIIKDYIVWRKKCSIKYS